MHGCFVARERLRRVVVSAVGRLVLRCLAARVVVLPVLTAAINSATYVINVVMHEWLCGIHSDRCLRKIIS